MLWEATANGGVPGCAAVPGCAGVCHCAGVPAPPYRGALAIGEQCNRRQMRFRVDYGIIYYMILGGWPGQLGGPRFGVANWEFLYTLWGALHRTVGGIERELRSRV